MRKHSHSLQARGEQAEKRWSDCSLVFVCLFVFFMRKMILILLSFLFFFSFGCGGIKSWNYQAKKDLIYSVFLLVQSLFMPTLICCYDCVVGMDVVTLIIKSLSALHLCQNCLFKIWSFCLHFQLLTTPVHELKWQLEEHQGLNYSLAAAANDGREPLQISVSNLSLSLDLHALICSLNFLYNGYYFYFHLVFYYLEVKVNFGSLLGSYAVHLAATK